MPLANAFAPGIDPTIGLEKFCAADVRFHLVGDRCVGGHEDDRFHSRSRGVHGHRATRVAVAGHGDTVDAEMLSHRHGQRKSSTFKAACGKLAFVLDR